MELDLRARGIRSLGEHLQNGGPWRECRVSGIKTVARGASGFCEHPWKRMVMDFVPRQRHWS